MKRRDFFLASLVGIVGSKLFAQSDNDEPSYTTRDGTKVWINEHGEYHRTNGPAIIHTDGCELWFKHGKPHRIGAPAQITGKGDELWFQDGELHRMDGPAIVEVHGGKAWYRHGRICKVEGGPAWWRLGHLNRQLNRPKKHGWLQRK